MKRWLTRGVALVELLVALAVLSIILGLGAVALRGAPERAQNQGLAEAVVEEIRVARQKAVRLGQPVGLAIPSEGGTKGHARSLYRVEGWIRPKVARVLDFEAEFPRSVLFVGFWPTSTGTYQILGPIEGSGPFDLTTWQHPYPNDPTMVFLPSGAMVSNFPLLDDAFNLVVCEGVEYGPASQAGFNGSGLSRIQSPVTLRVGRAGQVTLTSGLVQAQAGLIGQVTASTPAAVAPALAAGPNQDPSNLVVEAFPKGLNLPPGIDATVKQGGILSLEVTADDLDGDALACLWSTTDGGDFSSSQRVEMAFRNGLWHATWEWRPPDTASGSQVYSLTCQVVDGRGGVVNGQVGVSGNVMVLPRGRIMFDSDRSGTVEVYAMNADGTDLQQLTDNPGGDDARATYSGDGSMAAFISTRGGVRGVYSMAHDGSMPTLVIDDATLGGQSHWLDFSPDGTQIAGQYQGGGLTTVFVINVDGTHPDNRTIRGAKDLFTAPGWHNRGVDFTPDGLSVVAGGGPGLVVGHRTFSSDLYQIFLDGSPAVNLTQGSSNGVTEPVVSPDGNWIAWNNQAGLWKAQTATLPLVPVRVPTFINESPQFSPDATQFTTQNGLPPAARHVYVIDADGSNPRQLTQAEANNDNSVWVFR